MTDFPVYNAVTGMTGEGEVYALVYHLRPEAKGGAVEDVTGVRCLDRYRKENERWRFARRTGVFDWKRVTPIPTPEGGLNEREQKG
jgi:SnoaL-like domain